MYGSYENAYESQLFDMVKDGDEKERIAAVMTDMESTRYQTENDMDFIESTAWLFGR